MSNSTLQYLIITIFSALTITASGQKLRKIPKDIILQKSHPLDSSAHAAYIDEQVIIKYDLSNSRYLNLKLEYHFMTKIYDKEGEKYATFQIPFYESGSDIEKVKYIKGVTVNYENGEIVKTKLDKKDIYTEQTSDKNKTVKFAMPNVKAGSVIEVTYTVITPFLYSIPKWYFQNYIPTDKSEYVLEVPPSITLTPIPTGFHPIHTESKTINKTDTRYLYRAKNTPAFKTDKYVLNDNDYRSGIKYEVLQTNFPGRGVKNYSESWNKIAKRLKIASYFGEQFKKSPNATKVAVLKAKALPLEERKAFIYNYVKENFTWDGSYGKGSQDGLKKFTEKGNGNIGDINLLLYNLLRKCDVECYPLVLKSRGAGILNTNFPTLTDLNYMMVYIPTETSYELLDATSKYVPLGQIPNRADNLFGLVINESGGQIINLTSPNLYRIDTSSDYIIDTEKNIITGSSKQKRINYAATKYRIDAETKKVEEEEEEEEKEKNDDEQEADYEDFDLENGYILKDLKNMNNLEEPIEITREDNLVTCSKMVGDKIFIDATLYFGIKNNPFEEEYRDFPIFYNSKVLIRNYVTLSIPEGYTIDKLPEATSIALPDKKGQFKYTASEVNGKIAINYQFRINDTYHDPVNYPTLREFYNMMIEKNNEKIVLIKS